MLEHSFATAYLKASESPFGALRHSGHLETIDSH